MLSVTTLASYMYCPRKLYLTHVLKVVEPDKAALAIGETVHEALERSNKNEKFIVQQISEGISDDDIKSLYKNHYLHFLRSSIIKHKKRLNNNEIEPFEVFKNNQELVLNQANIRYTNLLEFMKTNRLYGQELWEKLTPKIYSEIALDSLQLTIRGIIDQIYDYGDHIEVVELKTGKAPESGLWPSHKLQLASYLIMAKEHFDIPCKASIKYLSANEERELIYSSFLIDEIKEIKFKVQELLSSKQCPPIIDNKNKCEACFLKQTCYQLNISLSSSSEIGSTV